MDSKRKFLLGAGIVTVILSATLSTQRFWERKSAKQNAVETTVGSGPRVAQANRSQQPAGGQKEPGKAGLPTKSGTGANRSANVRPGGEGQIQPAALKQMAALAAAKRTWTPVEQKIDTQLLYAEKMRQGMPIAEGVPTQRVDLDKDEQGRVLVDIKANVTDPLLQYIASLGGKVINDFPQYQAIRASVPLADIETLAGRQDVSFVKPAVRAMNNAVDSQGDYTHQANTARTTFGVNGSGLKIGVLSDSVDNLSASQIAGLVTVLSGQSGMPATGEGTAMLEIIHDLAPGAQLYFATGSGVGSSEAGFANNVRQLQAAGCNIIVDDVMYADESPFQDAVVAEAVNTVTANGVLYFSSAGNSGNEDDGTSGTWEGDFVDGGNTPAPMEAGLIHNFATGINANTCLGTGPGGSQLRADLFWSDPLGASSNDYDLYVLNSAGNTVIGSSLNTQNGTQDPYEFVGTISNGELIVIVKYSGAGRFLHLSTGRGKLSVSTQGSTRGHDCATNAFDVAATAAGNSYPNAFSGGAANPVETFSSDGPRRVFYQANGAPITPGNFSSTGGAVRQKPEITASDGVNNDLPDGPLNPFYGTSAAAPHAAAIAALLQSYNTNLTAAQVRSVLTSTALDIMGPGVDRDSGWGIVMAPAALEASPLPNLAKFTDNLNNSSPHPGDVVTVDLTVTNDPCSTGGSAAGAFHIGFYWSSSANFVGATPFYEAAMNGCAANGATSLNQNITITSGTTPGTYYLGYKIDDENEVRECNESDKGIYYWTITVLPPPLPNLTKSSDHLNNVNPYPGDVVTASITVTNELCTGGSISAGAFHIGFYGLSTTTTFAGLTPFYELAVNGCPANGSVSNSLNITIPAIAPGTYYLGYRIDDENELTECNAGGNDIYYWTVTVQSSSSPVQITVATAPTGLLVSLDNGASVAAPVTTSWNSGSTHTIATTTGQLSADSHTRYDFGSWSDGGAQSHSITPTAAGTYSAAFTTNYLLNTTAAPLAGGAVTNNPTGPWYSPGAVVQLTANPAGGYFLSSWSGEDSYSNKSATVTMNGYRNVTANFSLLTAPTLGGPSVANNHLVTSLSGLLTGETVIVQTSSNLQTWTAIQTNAVGGATLSITNPINPSAKSQFFRATVQ